jgi:hypothetical protein
MFGCKRVPIVIRTETERSSGGVEKRAKRAQRFPAQRNSPAPILNSEEPPADNKPYPPQAQPERSTKEWRPAEHKPSVYTVHTVRNNSTPVPHPECRLDSNRDGEARFHNPPMPTASPTAPPSRIVSASTALLHCLPGFVSCFTGQGRLR